MAACDFCYPPFLQVGIPVLLSSPQVRDVHPCTYEIVPTIDNNIAFHLPGKIFTEAHERFAKLQHQYPVLCSEVNACA